AASRTSAQICAQCPANAQATAIGDAVDVVVIRNGQEVVVSQQTVGSCETLIIEANVSYNAFGPGGKVGAGFSGGTGKIILPNGTQVDVPPPGMNSTLVGPPPCGTTSATNMNRVTYTITAADIAAGSATFTFFYTNGISALTNSSGQCTLKVSASPQISVLIAA